MPYCNSDGSFQDVQCNAHTGNCWCVSNNGLEFTETQSKKMPNCVTPSESLFSLLQCSLLVKNSCFVVDLLPITTARCRECGNTEGAQLLVSGKVS